MIQYNRVYIQYWVRRPLEAALHPLITQVTTVITTLLSQNQVTPNKWVTGRSQSNGVTEH